MTFRKNRHGEAGYTIVELLMACVIFPIIVVGVTNAIGAVQKSYKTARELNEIYAVLSACPELDRALDFANITSTTNCSPNNTFKAEGAGANIYSYNPVLTITDTTALPTGDPLKSIPDSKIVNITTGFIHSDAPDLQLRMLIARNGIAQQ